MIQQQEVTLFKQTKNKKQNKTKQNEIALHSRLPRSFLFTSNSNYFQATSESQWVPNIYCSNF